MILSELVDIFKLSNLKIVVAIYILLATFTIVMCPFYYFSLDNNFLIFTYFLFSLWIFDTFSYVGGNLFQGKKIFPKFKFFDHYKGLEQTIDYYNNELNKERD